MPRPKLGLNCVGGASSTAVAKSLAPGSTIVTYGGMSMKPLTIPTSLLIFKDLTCKGFWLSGSQMQHHELCSLFNIVALFV
jgi:trans-2-enoyl-CoA reductase